jgi:hypothetical protein
MRSAALLASLLLLLWPLACGGEGGQGGGDGGSGSACSVRELLGDDGSCLAIGVLPEQCGEGFDATPEGGCEPRLPDAPCLDGELALPGDDSCQPLTACGEGKWGTIPVEASTVYVEANSSGGDGSAAAPFATISEAIGAAQPGAIVAVAAGVYPDYVHMAGKAVRLWGRCPTMTEVVGLAQQQFAIDIEVGASGSEVHALAVTGPALGISVSGAEDVVIDSVWLHDLGNYGFDIEDALGPTSVSARRLLVERATKAGVYVADSTTNLAELVVRDTQPDGLGRYGRGINLEGSTGGFVTQVSHCVIQHNREAGIYALGAVLSVQDCLVADTAPQVADGSFGRGINLQGAAFELRRSVVRHAVEQGVLVAAESTADLEAVVVSDIESQLGTGRRGMGIAVQAASLQLRDSLVVRTRSIGVAALDSQVTVERSIVRDTDAAADGLFGDGLVATLMETGSIPELSVTDSIVAGSLRAGVANFGSAVVIGRVSLECNTIHLNGEPAQGLDAAFTNLGGNWCGCGAEQVTCTQQSAALQPPGDLD